MRYSKNFYQIRSNSEIFAKIVEDKTSVGYFDLPFQDISEIKRYAKTINKKNIFVVGMGGSVLGTKAIYDFLKTSNSYSKKLLFAETLDPLQLNYCLANVDLTDSHFLIISKSGNTIETISIMKYVNNLMKLEKNNCTIISEVETNLHRFALNNEIKFFEIDRNIGGRFSVFSVVGILPLAIIGINVENLLKGCATVYDSFFNMGGYYQQIARKARFMVENKHRFNINAVFSYSTLLESFNHWYIQLWAESLGEININGTRQALTPISLIGPKDQHSFLQLIMDGVRDKTITFIKIRNFKSDLSIPKYKNNEFAEVGMGYVEGITLAKLLNLQADSTIEAIKNEKDIPCDVIELDEVNELSIGKLMFTYQLLVSTIGAFLQIDTYNQPGVEMSKKILHSKLIENEQS